MATEGMNGPVVRGDTGPGGSSCVVMATEGMNGPVVRGDTGPGGSSCIFTLWNKVNLIGTIM